MRRAQHGYDLFLEEVNLRADRFQNKGKHRHSLCPDRPYLMTQFRP